VSGKMVVMLVQGGAMHNALLLNRSSRTARSRSLRDRQTWLG